MIAELCFWLFGLALQGVGLGEPNANTSSLAGTMLLANCTNTFMFYCRTGIGSQTTPTFSCDVFMPPSPQPYWPFSCCFFLLFTFLSLLPFPNYQSCHSFCFLAPVFRRAVCPFSLQGGSPQHRSQVLSAMEMQKETRLASRY